MSVDLFLDDKKFISVRRASQETGYSQDYIGQLCRQNKIPAKLIGRSWFVDLEYLKDYKNGVNQGNFNLSEFKKVNLPKSVSKLPYIPNNYITEEDINKLPYIEDKKSSKISLSFRNSFPLYFSVTSVALFVVLATSFSWLSYLSPRQAEKISNEISIVYERLMAFVSSGLNKQNFAQVSESVKTNTNEEEQGIVVIPNTEDSKTIEVIKNNFSDEVNVWVDQDGQTGVITPTFRSGQSGDGYAFIMVPVKEKK